MDPRETDHLDRAYGRVRRAVRNASSAELDASADAGAAQRIADGAWARAHAPPALRGKSARAKRRLARRGRILPFPRIIGLSAAAMLIAAAVFGMRGTEAAFAVVGDPVEVHDGDAWSPATKVREGQIVHAPQGERTLQSKDGTLVVPEPGSVFRVVHSDGPVSFRVELLRGQVEADGERLTVKAGDVLARRDLGASRLNVRVSFGETADPAEEAPPADPAFLTATIDCRPQVEALTSHVLISLLGSDETLRLKPAESAARVDLAGDPGSHSRPQRLAFVRRFSDQVQGSILASVATGDKSVIDAQQGAGGSIRVMIGGLAGALELLEVPDSEGAVFLDALNGVTMQTAVSFHIGGGAFTRSGEALAVMSPTTRGPAEYVMEKDGARTVIALDRRGAVTVTRGQTVQVFPNLASMHVAAPEIAKLFEGRLPAR